MKNDYILLNVFKDKGLLKGLIISLLTHFFLLTLSHAKKDKLLGDNYIPIEILDIKSPRIMGDSINESENKTNRIFSNKQNYLKQKSEEKFEKNLDDKKFNNFKDKSKNNEVEETLLEKPSSKQNYLKQKSEEKFEENLDDKKFNNFKDKSKNNEVEETLLEKPSSKQNLLGTESKTRGVEKGKILDKIETGSIQGKGSQKVTCLNCLEPKYPKLAIRRGYEGVLKLEASILKNGTVNKVIIKESTGFEILDQAGINAALNSTFYPLTKETTLKIEYTLNLN